MADYVTNIQNYTDIAKAIRYKNGESTTYLPSEMAAAIRNIISIIDITQHNYDLIFNVIEVDYREE